MFTTQTANHFKGKRILVTGHTGFKGSWLCEWLVTMGAEVTGLSLPPPTQPALFEQLGLAGRLTHCLGDIRDLAAVESAVQAASPEFVFHLAAQPLVRLSYEQPVETYATNVLGTVHVMDALRRLKSPCVGIMVTTDKCYENREWLYGYREEDPMGGFDPYSSSKGAAEIAIAAYRRSFFSDSAKSKVLIASGRAGNVIGGGDWALDRIIPDTIRSLQQGQPIPVRNPAAKRPWQHVLEPLSGYLELACALDTARQAGDAKSVSALASGFNFGPGLDSNRSVRDVVTEVLKHWPGTWADRSEPGAVHEAKLLNLATDKAHHLLGWRPRWDFPQTIERTTQWYRDVGSNADAADYTRSQIAAYLSS